MRKFQKLQAVDIINSIAEAHNEIKNFLDNKNSELAMNLLAQCQEGAYALSDFIANIEGEEHVVLNDFAKYCELVFQIHSEISIGKDVNVNNIFKVLNKRLLEIKRSVENNIETKIEIAFLPYKASMWDSMESVWIAASEDPRCDTYVVPIPYYDRNPDWSFKECFYEGDKFPSNVPITDYKEYNLESIKPDIIYIHNPYDGENFVTSVDPMYYSKKLKEQTGLLIYIPYFSNSGAMGNVGNISSSYFNIDNIIIQSEGVRSYFDKRVPSEKLVALGTPKFDRVLNICNGEVGIPDEWKSKIKGRKVYFYNTSIGGMLNDTLKFLYKMQYVFNTFATRDDICLLWRPHPLLESTFKSMRPHCLETFYKIKEFFIHNNLGIYDDTPDIEKAIGVSDAYIGDSGTSVTSLFGIAGKPIFILNNDISSLPTNEDFAGDFIKYIPYKGNNKWYTINQTSLYYSENDDYNYKYYLSLEDNESGEMYYRGIEVNDKVFVTPIKGNRVLVYENNKLIKVIQLKVYENNSDTKNISLLVKDNIYIFPNEYPAIVCIDTTTYNVTYIEGHNEIFRTKINNKVVMGGIEVWNDFLVISSPSTDTMLFINNKNFEVQIVKIGIVNSKGYKSLISNGNDLWCIPIHDNGIVRWNSVTGEYIEYQEFPQSFEYDLTTKELPFFNGIIYDNKLIITPFNSNMFISMDIITGKMSQWNTPFNYNDEYKSCYFNSPLKYQILEQESEDIIKICNMRQMKIHEVNLLTNESFEKDIKIETDEIIKNEIGFGKVVQGLAYCCRENAVNSLKDFLDNNIKGNVFDKKRQLEEFKQVAANSDGTCGLKIHEFAMDKIGRV